MNLEELKNKYNDDLNKIKQMNHWFDKNISDVRQMLEDEQTELNINESDWSEFEISQSEKLIEVLQTNMRITNLDKSKFNEVFK